MRYRPIVLTQAQLLINQNDKRLINQALKKLKLNKKDSIFNSVSDCYVHGPVNLSTHISKLVRTFLIHGAVSNFILLCTLIPLVKDGLGDITSSKNYRAIASENFGHSHTAPKRR